MPEWLAELAPTGEEPAAQPLAAGELPDWLAEMAPIEGEPAAPPAEEAEVPDWLREAAPTTEEREVAALGELQVPEQLAETALAAEESLELQPREAEVPEWLAEMAPADEEPGPLAIPAATIPEWLTAPTLPQPLAVEKEKILLPPAEIAPTPEEVGLAQAEIPAWLEALRPTAAPTPAPLEEEEAAETSGLLAGIAGVLKPAPAVRALPAVPVRPERVTTEATLARAKLWQQLIARSAQPELVELSKKPVTQMRERIERWLIYGIVLVAVFVPVVTSVDLSSVFVQDEPLTEDTGAAYDLVDQLASTDTPVLVAFDYDPSYMGELHLQAEAVLRHLARNEAQIITIGLTPEGAGLAQQAIDDVWSAEDYRAGEGYVNLGYLPGEAVGIRSLEFLPREFQQWTFDGRELSDVPALGGDDGFALSNMSLIIVLTGNVNNIRWWVEQITVLEEESDRELLLVAGVSAAIEPLVRPYYDMATPQINGLIVGLPGAADYERSLDLSDGPARIRLNGQLVGRLTVLALILLGMLIYGTSRQSGRAA